MNGSLKKNVFGAACLSLQPIVLNAVSVPATAYIVRGLGPQSYGCWAMATALIATTTFLTNLGLRGTFVRAVARDPACAAGATADQLGIRTLLAVAAAAVSLAACAALGYPAVVLKCTAVAAAGLVLTSVYTTLADLLQALRRFPALSAVSLVAGLVLTAASVVAVRLGAGPAGLAAVYLLGPALSTAGLWWVVRRGHFPVRVAWDVGRFWRLLRDCRAFTAQQLVATASANAEALLLPRLAGPTTFGVFAAGTLLADRMGALPDGIGTAAYPDLARTYRDDPAAAGRRAAAYLCAALLACLPVAILGAYFAGPIAQILLGARAADGRRVIAVTVWAVPLVAVDCVMGYALNAAGREGGQAKASLAAAACNIAVAVALVTRLGLAGACWSWALRPAVRIAARGPLFVRTFSPAGSAFPVARILACGAAMAGPMWAAGRLFGVGGAADGGAGGALVRPDVLARLGAVACVGVVAYAAAGLALRVVNVSQLSQIVARGGPKAGLVAAAS